MTLAELMTKNKIAGTFPKRSLILGAVADTKAIREETFRDTKYLVIPVIALVEGVHQASNAATPELALASEFGKVPQSWDGRPVVLRHPVVDGKPVSANSPEVLEAESFGQIFHTRLEGRKLRLEAWLNLGAVETIGGEVAELVTRLQTGELVDVSVGAFITVLPAEGTFDGETYNGLWTDILPDHLAFLPEGIAGACSVDDGCGAPRLNAATLEWAPGTSGGTGPTANNPEGQAAQSDTVKVHFTRLLQRFGALLFRPNREGLSDIDVREALMAALVAADPDPMAWIWVIAVFEESVIYERDGLLFERNYTLNESTGNNVKLDENIIGVRAVTDFVPLSSTPTEGEVPMELAARVKALIDNPKSRYVESDRKWLEGMKEEQLDILEDAPELVETEPAEGGTGSPEPVEAAPPSQEIEPAQNRGVQDTTTPEKYLESAPPEIQEVLQQGLEMHRARKSGLIKGLMENSRNAFTEADLKGMVVGQLENLSKLANIPNYEGRNLALPETPSDNGMAPTAPLVFERKQA